MCGRITLTSAPHVLAARFSLAAIPDITPRYNISPTADVAVVLPDPRTDGCLLRMVRWGLVPPWSRGPDRDARMFNARSETVTEKPAFREAFVGRRCLVPVDGFYEWQKRSDGRQPFLFRHPDHDVFALAALWDRWEYPGGRELVSCSILTTAANKLMRPIHHRMPVILAPEHWPRWLRAPADESEDLLPLLRPATAGMLRAHPVSRRVNDGRLDDPQCIEPIADDRDPQLDLF